MNWCHTETSRISTYHLVSHVIFCVESWINILHRIWHGRQDGKQNMVTDNIWNFLYYLIWAGSCYLFIGLNLLMDLCLPQNLMTSSNGNIFHITGPLCGEFTGDRWIPHTKPVMRSFDVSFDLHLNERLSKQWWGWSFEMPSHTLWCHCTDLSR